ncbi:MAG: glutamyl-tRNA reductase [Deltaproteobacteria bacterium]|nr:glutamyl-tRNA reductase [Deltaproteobacteria bacterium]
MKFVSTSLSHKRAKIELRERVAQSIGGANLADSIKALHTGGVTSEVCVLSTCNRVEIYVAGHADPAALAAAARRFVEFRVGLSPREFAEHFDQKLGNDGVLHLFRVASSLDSMVLGEPQILGQVKEAYRVAFDLGTVGPILNASFQRAFGVAKRVRTDTGIGDGAVSMSYGAVELGRQIFSSLAGKKVLLIGAGKMSALAAKHLRDHGVSEIRVANRTLERAEKLASEVGGIPASLADLESLLVQADIVISSTSSPGYVVDKKMVQKLVRARRYRPLLFVDLAVPRDIDPTVATIDNVFVYDVDDLEGVLENRRLARAKEAEVAERLVASELDTFVRWSRSQEVKPVIVALREKLLDVARAEAERTIQAAKIEDKKVEASVQRMGEAIVNKALHTVLTRLKKEGAEGDPTGYVDALTDLFELQIAPPEVKPAAETEGDSDNVVPFRRASQS